MQAHALQQPAAATFQRFAAGMERLAALLWSRACPQGDLYLRFSQRVREITAEILALAALLAAGTLPTPRPQPRRKAGTSRTAAPRTARPQPAPAPPPFPNDRNWLVKLLRHEAAVFGIGLYEQIQEADMQALLAAAPDVGDRLREIFLACGSLKDAEAFLPPPRSTRFRRHQRELRAEQAAEAKAAADAIAAYEAAMAEAAQPAPTSPDPPASPSPSPAASAPWPHRPACRRADIATGQKIRVVTAAFRRY